MPLGHLRVPLDGYEGDQVVDEGLDCVQLVRPEPQRIQLLALLRRQAIKPLAPSAASNPQPVPVVADVPLGHFSVPLHGHEGGQVVDEGLDCVQLVKPEPQRIQLLALLRRQAMLFLAPAVASLP